jgi:hypothetical protein
VQALRGKRLTGGVPLVTVEFVQKKTCKPLEASPA